MTSATVESRQQTLRVRLSALGFDDVRFAAIDAPKPALTESPRSLEAWVRAGMQADMHWMERSLAKRLNPDLVLAGARSIIMLGVNYSSERQRAAKPAADPRWARYALYEDYHDTIKPALVAAGHALEEIFGVAGTDYRYYVDTGPVIDRGWAARAGIGFIGKNAMLISRTHGNWLLLAAILTRIEFVPDAPIRKTAGRHVTKQTRATERTDHGSALPGDGVGQRRTSGGGAGETRVGTESADVEGIIPTAGLLCGKCTRCLDACPTNAFAEPGVVDARRCISYQTIENKGVIPRELRAGIGNRIYGCDVCLEVCPWNRFAREGRRLLLAARDDIAGLPLQDLLALTPERFAEVFRRTPIKRLKLVGLLRNACIVAGNSGDRSLLPQLVSLATAHSLALVRAHAVWAVFRLGGGEQLAAARATEADPIVQAEYAAERSTPA